VDNHIPPVTADQWNKEVPVGTKIRYWPSFDPRKHVDAYTSSPAFIIENKHVVKLKDIIGCFELRVLGFNYKS
jgi:hypothetical protein